jgi:hypothetical protein
VARDTMGGATVWACAPAMARVAAAMQGRRGEVMGQRGRQ